jgi:hypothetical protein
MIEEENHQDVNTSGGAPNEGELNIAEVEGKLLTLLCKKWQLIF